MFLDEPKPKRKGIPKSVKDAVWNKYIGAQKAEGTCYVCGRTIHIRDFDVGHNRARARGGTDNISNLRPICRTCNSSMGTISIETYKAKHFGKPRRGKKSAKDSAIYLDKVKTYLTNKGYTMSSKRHGFDLIGTIAGNIFDVDRYVVVSFNNEVKLTADYVLRFKKKLIAYYQTKSQEYLFGSPHIEGLIAYTGILSKDAPLLVKSSKPQIRLKKLL